MKIQVLGPLSAEVGGMSVVPTAGKPRQILALLALFPGRVVPVATLLEEIWGTEPPRSALTTLQTYVLQLRRRLGTAMGPGASGAGKDVLATRHGGYLLQIETEAVDVHEYERLLGRAQQTGEEGDEEESARTYREALALWDGNVLSDVRLGPVLRIEATRLEESRLLTRERCVDADLRLGRHAEVVGELVDLIASHPEHEPLHAQAMVALYRAGRRAGAADVYDRLHQRLVEELGIEPAPQLQRLRAAMLARDPQLDVLRGTRRSSTFDLYAA